jgi:cytochrome c-type biogenesis protein CcmH/NrfF
MRPSKLSRTGHRLSWPVRLNLRWLALALVAVAALAQTASEKPSMDVRRVGARIACTCGCKDSVATCSMLECHISKPAKERIAKMQALGYSDKQIVDAFIRDYGLAVYLAEPNAWGWAVPYATVGLGLVVIWIFIKKYRKPKPIAVIGPMEVDDPALEKYKDQIEKDLANME